jgi:glucose-6-phosphate isomerase
MLSKINPIQTNSWKALDEHFAGNDFDLEVFSSITEPF